MARERCSSCGGYKEDERSSLCSTCQEKKKEQAEMFKDREDARRQRQSKPGGYRLSDLFRDWSGK